MLAYFLHLIFLMFNFGEKMGIRSPSVAIALVRVACCQLAPQVGNKQFNLEKTASFIKRVADQGATVVVLPELSNSGYVFESRAEALSLADTYADGETTALWTGLAKEIIKTDAPSASGIRDTSSPPIGTTGIYFRTLVPG